MVRTLTVILFVGLTVTFGEVVHTTVVFEGKELKANAVWEVPEGINPADRGAILWLHGLFQTHSMMEPISQQRRLWVAGGYPVLSPTLTLGINDRREPYDCSYTLDHTYELNLEELKVWLRWLRKMGVKKVVLAGHSKGGEQIVHLAKVVSGEPKVVGLLLVAPSKGEQRKHPLLEKAKRLVRDGAGHTVLRGSFFYCREVSVSARTLWSYYGVDRNIGKALREVGVPVLVVWGGEDERVRDLPRFLKRHAGDMKNLRIEVIDYADHFFRDLAAEDLSALALEFFEEVLRQRLYR